MELFYFHKELVPFYLWALGGILLGIFALCKVNRFWKEHSDELLQKESSIWRKKYTAILLGFFAYLFCGILVVGFMLSSVSLCLYGCVLVIFCLAIFSNLSKK